MHYITGTSISIKSNPKAPQLSRREKQFTVNTPYQLTSITKRDNLYYYTFKSTVSSEVELPFESCRDADVFIAGVRNEIIPDYDAKQDNGDL